MQRKIPNINFRNLLSSSSGVDKLKLHSIPINKMKNVKSNVLYSIPGIKHCAHFCGIRKLVSKTNSNPTHSEYNHGQATTPYDFARDVSLSPVVTGFAHCMLARKLRTPFAKHMGVVASILLLLCFFSVMSSTSCYATTTATLELGTSSLNTTVTQGDVAYLSSTISATTTDTESYTLTITGPTNLTGASTISGANGNTPANMANNTWGYSYDEGSKSNDSKIYKSFTGSAQELESGTIASGTAKDITFAAKFGSDAVSGHYSAEVKLSLVATPKRVVFNGITTMQEMTPEICKNAAQNETKQLKDSRDNKLYWVTKLKDDNCWMTQNLDYDGGGEKRITISEWASSSSDGEYWDPGNKVGNGNGEDATSTTDQHLLSGNYYNYTAALTVCPSGWRLPTSNSTTINGSFGKLLDGITTGDALNVAPYYFQYGGFINLKWSGSAVLNGGTGEYWSSTPNDDIRAYSLKFSTSNIDPSYPQTDYGRGRSNGLSVRCVAEQPTIFTLTFDPGDDDTYTLGGGSLTTFNSKFPVQSASTTSGTSSYSFTIPSESTTTYYSRYDAPTSFRQFYIKGWTTTKGSTTVQYNFGATVTVNASSPNLTLYPVWQGINGGGAI